MERTQARRILVLSAVLVGLTFLLWLGPVQGAPDRIEIFDPPDEVVGITIERADGTVALQYTDRWRLGPEAASDDEVRRIIDALEPLRWAEPVDVPPDARLGDFGLDPVWARVTVTSPTGPQTIDLGVPAEVGHRSYVRGPDGQILVAPGEPHTVLGQPAIAFLDPQVVEVGIEDLQRLRFETGKPWSIERYGALWLVDGRFRGDPDRIEAWLRVWGSVRVDRQDAAFEPAGRLVFEVREGPPIAVEVRREGRDVRLRYADGTRTGIASLEPALTEPTPQMFVAPRLLGIDRSATDHVAVNLGGTQWEGRRNGPAWTSSIGDGASWNVVSALADLPQVEAPPRARRTPPARLWGRLTWTEEGVSVTVLLGRPRNDLHLAWFAEAEAPVAVPAAAVAAVLAELDRQ